MTDPDIDGYDEDDEDDAQRGVSAPTFTRPPKLFADVLDVEEEPSQGLRAKLGTGLISVVAIPLALVVGLISIVISTALPILLILALVKGPGDMWNMVRAWVPGSVGGYESAACEGFVEWFNASNSRGDRLYELVQPAQNG